MITSRLATTLLMSAGLALASHGVGSSATRTAKPAAATRSSRDVQPESVAALRAMSAYLRSLPAFEVRAATVRDEISEGGQKLQFTGQNTYQLRKPDGFMVEMAEDRTVRQLYYDGRSLTLYAPRDGFYAHVPAPPTVRDTMEAIYDRYGIEVPLADLFRWGQGDDGTADLTSGYRVGYARVDGVDADQYAFRQRGVDWQIWIARGDKPLPLRVVVTDTSDRAQPQFEATLTWNVAPKFAANAFVFQPPKDSKAISIASVK